MNTHRVATVISYCTNDYRFLDLCIEEARCFSSQIIIVAADHFFNGEPENLALLEKSRIKHPDCLFVEFAYKENEPFGLYCPVDPEDENWAHYWHSTSRYIGFHCVEEEMETILFLDVDEVPDGERFREWLESSDYKIYEAIRLASYFYFRSASYRALTWLPNSLLVRKGAIHSENLLNLWERQGIFDEMAGKKMQMGVGLDEKPLIHHFSWVRTKEEMLIKTKAWGHRHDQDWAQLIEQEFAASFSLIDHFYGLHYEEVEPWRDPMNYTYNPSFHIHNSLKTNYLHFNKSSFFQYILLKAIN